MSERIEQQANQPEYVYRGDRLTDACYRGKTCSAIRNERQKCIRGKNGNMLVRFEGKPVVVLARQLRKIKKDRD